MSIFFKKTNSITITPHPVNCIWNVPTDGIAVNTQVIIDTGCIATYVVNGQYRQTFESGNKILINEKWEHKSISKIALVAANSEKVVEICCGVGGVPFNDRELEADTVVGTNADMKLRVKDPWKLYTMMGNRDITADEINEFLRGKLAEELRAELAKQLQFNTYFTLTAQTNKMSEKVAEQIKKVISGYGLYMLPNSFALGNFLFNDDYLELRKRAGDSRAENKIIEEEIKTIRKRSRVELETIGAIGETVKSNNAQSANTKCSKCGTEVNGGTNFCPVCGAKI